MVLIIVIEELFNGLLITMKRDDTTLIQYEVFEPYTSDKAFCGYIGYHIGTIKKIKER